MSQLTDNLSAIASIKSDIRAAIESKGVSMSGVSFGSYADKIGEIQTGGGTFVTETLSVSNNGTYTPSQGVDGFSQVVVNVPQSVTGFTEKDITEGVNVVNLSNSASYVGSFAFAYNSHIETVNLPNCLYLQSEAFASCSKLQTVNLPNCVSVGIFGGNSIKDNNVFNSCSSLYYVSLPSCIEIGASCFRGCSALQSIELPVCKSVDGSAFNACTSLSYVSLPICSTIGSAAFNQCSKLREIYIPQALQVSSNAFISCSSLSQISLPIVNNIGNYAFSRCSTLNSLTLCTDVFWTLQYQNNMLASTPIMSGTGSIYVRSDTYSNWITSTGWSSLSNRFVSVSLPGPILSFSSGLVSGLTKCMRMGFNDYLGVSIGDVTEVNLPECIFVQVSAFYDCNSLSKVTLPVCSYIGNLAFYRGNTSVNLTITLGYSGVVVAGGAQVIYPPVSIYVPASLIEDYKIAPNWSYWSSYFYSIQ